MCKTGSSENPFTLEYEYVKQELANPSLHPIVLFAVTSIFPSVMLSATLMKRLKSSSKAMA